MNILPYLIRPFAKYLSRRVIRDRDNAVADQQRILKQITSKAKDTRFGIDHKFAGISSHEDFMSNVPIRDYESLRDYFDAVAHGEPNVLWPGKPKYFAKTSGTTSGVKYIPITHASMPNHFGTARNALMHYAAQSGNYDYFGGKMIFLSGSPKLEQKSGINTGRLSGIVNHVVPAWIRRNQLPSLPINMIEDWEEKVNAIVAETRNADMRLISGNPAWMQMYFENLLEKSEENTLTDLFPGFSVLVYGGVNFSPYREALQKLIGKEVAMIETYPASEGFLAFQDEQPSQGLLLNTNSGIFFEFIPVDEFGTENPTRLSIVDVEIDVNYALIINSNAGLWGYVIGDTVEFVSLDPYRIRVTGRTKHFISAFGEHVIGKEVDEAIQHAMAEAGGSIAEFTVAPQVNPIDGLPYHEWLIEFSEEPTDLSLFANAIDHSLAAQNIYYKDLIDGNILRPAVVTVLKRGAFVEYMKSVGKLGGQNKVPRLTDERKIADFLQNHIK